MAEFGLCDWELMAEFHAEEAEEVQWVCQDLAFVDVQWFDGNNSQTVEF